MNSQPFYWTDPLKDEFDVEIESILEANGNTYLTIKEQVVKPVAGGQAGDRGVLLLGGMKYEFIDTIQQNENVVLVMKNTPASKGPALLKLDMGWRNAMMTNHTSEHIFVGKMQEKYPEVNLGRIWIDGIHGTVDLEGKVIPLDEILETEAEVNSIIRDAISVTTKVVTAAEVDESVRAREGLTAKNDIIRLVNVGKLDSSACSGIHVTNTSEIRVFKIIDVKAHEGNTHIEFVSGTTAVRKLVDLFNIALIRKNSYPYEIEQLGAILDKSKTLQVSYDEAIEKILQLMKEGPNKEQIDGITFWHEYLPGCEISTVRHLIKEVQLTEPAITFFLTTGKKTNIVLWTKGMQEDAAYYIADIVQDLGGRGGGSAEAYTGGFTDVENPHDLFLSLIEKIKNRIVNN